MMPKLLRMDAFRIRIGHCNGPAGLIITFTIVVLLVSFAKSMDFSSGMVWVMGLQEVMGYGMQFPAYQIGGSKMLWDKRGYGLSGVWVKRESSVDHTWVD